MKSLGKLTLNCTLDVVERKNRFCYQVTASCSAFIAKQANKYRCNRRQLKISKDLILHNSRPSWAAISNILATLPNIINHAKSQHFSTWKSNLGYFSLQIWIFLPKSCIFQTFTLIFLWNIKSSIYLWVLLTIFSFPGGMEYYFV